MIQFFEQSQSADIPFLSDLLKTKEGQKLDGQVFDVESIIYASSGKGYLVKTSAFSVFIWKNQKTTQQMLEALNLYWEQGNGFVFVVQVALKVKDKHRIGVDFERTSYWQKKGDSFISTSSLTEDIPLMEPTNPFLPPNFPTTQSRALQMADEMTIAPESSNQTPLNGSRTSRKRLKAQST